MSAFSELCQQIVICRKCEVLAEYRTQVVPGDGDENADMMFIGEAPGTLEFVGIVKRTGDRTLVELPRDSRFCPKCQWLNIFRVTT